MPSTRHAYTHLEGIYLPIAVAVFALVVVGLVLLLARGRRRAQPGRRSEALALEIVYACALACVAGFLVWTTFKAETPIDRTVARPGLRIRVTAAQWSWRFEYPNGAVVSDVSSWTPPAALVPTGTEVEFAGSSEDVIHGFWVPRLDFQRQLLPSYTTRFDLLFEAQGAYPGECSVFCGEQHSEMHFMLRAVKPAVFAAWLARQGAATAATVRG